MNQLVECVPNFSEGRDKDKIKQITDSIEKISGVELLDVDIGSDTNRTVVTFIGSPNRVEEAAFQAVKKASEIIDMRKHEGAHPRMGATRQDSMTVLLITHFSILALGPIMALGPIIQSSNSALS